MKPNRHKVLTRLERFWFATGIIFFGLKGIPVERRSLPKATPSLPKAVSKADARKDTEPSL